MSINFTFNEEGYDNSTPYNFTFGEEGVIYNLFKSIPNFTSVWADATTGVDAGKVYIASQDYLYIIDLDTHTLYDWYSPTKTGRAEETLNSNDIVDINVI